MSLSIALADAISATEPLLTRYLEGFSDRNAVTQAPNLPNHVAWSLGHLALTMHRAAEKISGRTVELGYAPEPFAFGSKPTAAARDYPPLQELVQRFHKSVALLADTLRTTGDEGLQRSVTWGMMTTNVRDLAMRMVFHNGTHAGQIVDLRRALGMPQLIQPPSTLPRQPLGVVPRD
jgi:DinB family protein